MEATDIQLLQPKRLGLPSREPLVSVLISNYNYGRFISTAIESVLNQTYRHLELIVCDDGSTDYSIEVVRQYFTDTRIRLIQKQNGGQATGFNAAYREAMGEIICFLDADDFYLPTKLQRVVDCALANPDCGCILNGFLRVDKNRKVQGVMPLLTSLPSGWCAEEVMRNGGILTTMPCTPGLNLRRAIAEELFPLPVRSPLNRFADMVIMRLTPLMSRFASINEPLAAIQLHDSNTYQRHRVTGETIQREIDVCEELWEEQRRYLAALNSRLPALLQRIDAAPIIAQQRYICSRMNGTADRSHSRKLLANVRKGGQGLLRRLFWNGTILLPDSIFSRVVNVALTQNRFKQAIAHLTSFTGLRRRRFRVHA
jgi:glycosyltransferase involved in cell wall biosynthesis